MLWLGLILLIIGWFLWRPLVYVGAVLAVIGLILYLAHVGAYGGWPAPAY